MQVVLKESVHGGALGLLAPGTVDVPDSLAHELVATKRATWPGSRPNAWPDPSGASLVSGAGNQVAAKRWFGPVQNAITFNETGVFSIANYGGGMKIEADAPFDAVRLVWVSRAANAMTASTALVGVTETADTSTATTAFHPVIGGALYNTTVAFPNTLGWRAVTWAGASSVDHPAANLAAQVKISDWIPLASVPRADGGTRPLLLIRAQHDGSAAGNFATFSNAAISALRTAISAARNRIMQTFTGTSMVSSVAAVNGAIGTATYEIYPEFRYRVPVSAVWGVGDSTLQCESLGLTGGITTWGWRGCADATDASGGTKVYAWSSFGCSGKQYAEFLLRFQEAVTAGSIPDILIFQPVSINDYSGDIANIGGYLERGRSRAADIVSYCKTNKIRKIVFMGLLPYNTLTAVPDAARKAYNSWLSAFAAANGFGYLNFAALGDGASPERWVTAYNYSADGIHPNETAIDAVMAPALAAALAAT